MHIIGIHYDYYVYLFRFSESLDFMVYQSCVTSRMYVCYIPNFCYSVSIYSHDQLIHFC